MTGGRGGATDDRVNALLAVHEGIDAMARGTFIARIAVLTALAAVLASCGGPPPPSGPVQVEIDGISTEVLASERFTGVYDCGTEQVDVRVTVGTTTAGDDFVLVVPQRDWSGDLVVFAHGYRDPALPAGFWEVVPDDFTQVLDALGDLSGGDLSGGVGQAMALALCSFTVDLLGLEKTQGAFAASSYSANGYATEVAVPETHVLNALFPRYFPAPTRTYVTGASLGGLVALQLAERYPDRYHGALPVCGPVGGSLLQLSYVGHVELMFRYFYPGAFDGGSRGEIDLTARIGPYVGSDDPTGPDPSVVQSIVDAVEADPEPLAELGRLEIENLAGERRLLLQHDPTDPNTLLSSVLEAFFFAAVGKADIVDLAGGFPFDNQDVTYYGDDGALVDPNLVYKADPAALAYFANHYQPTGQLRIPTVTVHNLYDPVVPEFHESAYDLLVTDAGWSANLATATVPIDGFDTSTDPFGHCAFAEEVVVAFAALSEWVESGSRPFVLGTFAEDSAPLH